MDRGCSTYGEENKCIQDLGGKVRRKEIIRKNETLMGG
jgi:hypothetical protein